MSVGVWERQSVSIITSILSILHDMAMGIEKSEPGHLRRALYESLDLRQIITGSETHNHWG